MWNQSRLPQHPPPYFDPNNDPARQFINQGIPSLSHHGAPPPVHYPDLPPPPAGSVGSYQPPPQQGGMMGSDEWIQVNHGSPFPNGAIQAMDRNLNNNDHTATNCYVALCYVNGEPVFGRAWNNRGTVEAWFPHGGEEKHSRNVGPIKLLTYRGPPFQNFRYGWVPMRSLNAMCQPVRDQSYSPCVVTNVHAGSFNGEILGKANVDRQMAWISHAGKEHNFTGNQFQDSYILCRVPL